MPAPRRRPTRSAAATLTTLPQLRRLLWALRRLRIGQPLRGTDLATQFEVAMRTGYRDLGFLRDERAARWVLKFGVGDGGAEPGLAPSSRGRRAQGRGRHLPRSAPRPEAPEMTGTAATSGEIS